MTTINVFIDKQKHIDYLEHRIRCLKTERDHLLILCRDIEAAIDHDDKQQISVAIKRLRDHLGTEKLYKGNLKPGLVRE